MRLANGIVLDKEKTFGGGQFLKIKPTEKNIDDIADILGQSEILEPDAKKRRNSARHKNPKSDKN